MDMFPKFIAAAVQASSVFLNRDASVAKACELIRQAAANGAQLIGLPECFIPGYPYWCWAGNPLEGARWFRELYKQSVEVPSPATDRLCQAAYDAQAYVAVGIVERNPLSMGGIYNTNLLISPHGRIELKHRKITPSWPEKLIFAFGDGSSLRVCETQIGRLGVLTCGENTNTLARFTLLAQGENVHIANFCASPWVDHYNYVEAIKIRMAAHCFEGKIFGLAVCSAMSDDIVELLGDREEKIRILSGAPNAFTGIFGPTGNLLTEPLVDKEGIVYAEIDLEECIEPKLQHDLLGHYNRFDIFDLHVNNRPHTAVNFLPFDNTHYPVVKEPEEDEKINRPCATSSSNSE